TRINATSTSQPWRSGEMWWWGSTPAARTTAWSSAWPPPYGSYWGVSCEDHQNRDPGEPAGGGAGPAAAAVPGRAGYRGGAADYQDYRRQARGPGVGRGGGQGIVRQGVGPGPPGGAVRRHRPLLQGPAHGDLGGPAPAGLRPAGGPPGRPGAAPGPR